jgi:hypothetical protein
VCGCLFGLRVSLIFVSYVQGTVFFAWKNMLLPGLFISLWLLALGSFMRRKTGLNHKRDVYSQRKIKKEVRDDIEEKKKELAPPTKTKMRIAVCEVAFLLVEDASVTRNFFRSEAFAISMRRWRLDFECSPSTLRKNWPSVLVAVLLLRFCCSSHPSGRCYALRSSWEVRPPGIAE